MVHTRRTFLRWCAAVPAMALVNRLYAGDAPADSWRTSGSSASHAHPFDQAMRQFMEAQKISAAQLAIVTGGSLVLNHAYSNITNHGADEANSDNSTHHGATPHHHGTARREPVTPQSLFRLASCSKLFTCAAITHLRDSGKLTLNEPVFPLLGISSPALKDQKPDQDINNITVKDLVYHAGGWVSGGPFIAKDGKHIRGGNFDPVFEIRKMSLDLNLNHPLSKMQMAQYMYGRQLQFRPGKQNFTSTNGNSYSNFGYVLLGMVVEKVTGKHFVQFLREGPLSQDGTHDVFLSHTNAQKRLPDEVWYEDPHKGPSALEPRSNVKVPYPYGGEGWMTERMDSGGGLATTAATLAKFISKHAVWDLGGRAPGSEREGSMAGTTSYAFSRPNGVDCALIFNTRNFENQNHTFDSFITHMRTLLDSTSFH